MKSGNFLLRRLLDQGDVISFQQDAPDVFLEVCLENMHEGLDTNEKESNDEFFLRPSDFVNRTPPRRFKISTQTLLENIAKGCDYWLVEVSKVSANGKCPKKNHNLTLKMGIRSVDQAQ